MFNARAGRAVRAAGPGDRERELRWRRPFLISLWPTAALHMRNPYSHIQRLTDACYTHGETSIPYQPAIPDRRNGPNHLGFRCVASVTTQKMAQSCKSPRPSTDLWRLTTATSARCKEDGQGVRAELAGDRNCRPGETPESPADPWLRDAVPDAGAFLLHTC